MNILMSGSGSGGHIYPCIALYNELKKDNKITIVIFKEIDKKIYDLNNINYVYINDNEKKFRKICKLIKENDIKKTITFGGKNSVLINFAAKLCKIDNYIFEQNVILGKANKLNYIFCKKIFTNFKINLKKEVYVGNPNSYNTNVKKLNLFNNNKPTILFTMGSLGSSTIDKTITKFINQNQDFNIIYVLGNNIKSKIKNTENVKIFNYYNPLIELINISDIIVSRAGASTLSEILSLKKISIIIPSPYVTNNHQYKNAKYLYSKNLIEMIEEKNLTLFELKNKIYKLTLNKEINKKYMNNLKTYCNNNNFQIIRNEILNDNL